MFTLRLPHPPLGHPASHILLVLHLGFCLALITSPCHAEGGDVFAGLGFTDAPNRDITGQLWFGGGYMVDRHLSLGGHGMYSDVGGGRLIFGGHGKFVAAPKWPLRPYGLLGIDFLDIAAGKHNPYGTEWRLMPRYAFGAELGWRNAALFAELSYLTRYRILGTLPSGTVGLHFRFGTKGE